jgi:hypothetical protein
MFKRLSLTFTMLLSLMTFSVWMQAQPSVLADCNASCCSGSSSCSAGGNCVCRCTCASCECAPVIIKEVPDPEGPGQS